MSNTAITTQNILTNKFLCAPLRSDREDVLPYPPRGPCAALAAYTSAWVCA